MEFCTMEWASFSKFTMLFCPCKQSGFPDFPKKQKMEAFEEPGCKITRH